MKNKINWIENDNGSYNGEGKAGIGIVEYHLNGSAKTDENGPYFNIMKKYNNNEHYYYQDIDGIPSPRRQVDYSLDEAYARCEKDYAIVIDKNQLEWFHAPDGKDDVDSPLVVVLYAFNPNDGSEYRICRDMSDDGVTNEEFCDKRYYYLLKLEKNGENRGLNKGHLTKESCKKLAQEDFLGKNKTRESL